MDRRTRLGAMAGLSVMAGLCLMAMACPGRSETVPPSLVVANLDYVDTSGEVVDQRAEHARRLNAFAETLRSELRNSGKLRVVDCRPDACAASTTDPAKLIAAAEDVGATYLLFGGVHKESTLLQWAKIEILDVKSGKVVFDRLLTFRGDDDVAWQRAEAFVARDILSGDALSP